MTKTAPFTLCLMLIFSILCTGKALCAETDVASQNQINWYRADFPPVTIPNGPYADTGFFDKAMNLIVEGLENSKHQFSVANFKRIITTIKSNENACCPSLYKTREREEFIAFSIPAMIVLPNGIISLEKNRHKLSPHIDENGKISLHSLLQDKNISLGISTGRKYSGGIDEILQEYAGKKNLMSRPGNDVFQGLMSMMYKDRIDCLIGYPIEAEYFAKSNNTFQDNTYYQIKESSVPFTVGYIGCSNSIFGRSVIEQINAIVRNHRHKEFIEFYGYWLNSSTKNIHRKMALEYFRSLPD